MALQTIVGGLRVPYIAAGAIAYSQFQTLNASGEKASFIVRVPAAGDIARVGFRLSTVTTATDTDVRIETVDLATGNPTGTLVNAGANVTVLAASLTSNTWIWATLGTPAAVAANQYVALVLAPTGTPNYQVTSEIEGMEFQRLALPVADHSVDVQVEGSVFALEYASGVVNFIHGILPHTAAGSQAMSQSAAPGRGGLRFKNPVKARLAEVEWSVAASADWQYIIYDADGSTILYTSPTWDAQVFSTSVQAFAHRIPAASRPVLLKDTFYRIAIAPTTATAVTVRFVNADAATTLDFWHGGQDYHWTQATVTGAPTGEGDWTQTLTRRPWIVLKFDQFDDGAGGGGGGAGSGKLRRRMTAQRAA